jgi:O-antigen/teichoic acid export membrane protein
MAWGMAGRSVLQNAAFTLVGQLAARLLALLFYAVLARQFGPERYGDQGVGAALGTLLVVLVEPGLNQLLVREGARRHDALLGQASVVLGYKLVSLVLVWPLCVLLGAALGYRDVTLWAVVWAGGTILCGALEDLFAAVLTAAERLDLEGLTRLLSKVFSAGLGLGAMAAGVGFEGVLGAVTLGTLLSGAAGLMLARRAGVAVRPAFSFTRVQPLLQEAWPLAVHNVLWLITLRLDQVLARGLGVPDAELGAYNAAVKLLEALILFPTAVVLAFNASLSRAGAQGADSLSRRLHQATAALAALCIPVAVGGACLSEGLSTLVYGDRFGGTGALLGIQLGSLLFVGLQSLSSVALTASGRVRVQAWTVAVNLLVNVALNVVLVPRMGVAGASWAAVGGGVAASVAYGVALRSAGVSAGVWAALWRPALAAAAMAGVLVWTPVGTLHVLVAVGVGGAVFGGVFVMAGGWSVLRALQSARREA